MSGFQQYVTEFQFLRKALITRRGCNQGNALQDNEMVYRICCGIFKINQNKWNNNFVKLIVNGLVSF